MITLTDMERRWLDAKWAKIRASQEKADAAGNQWTELNEAVKDWLKRSRISDPVQVAKIKGLNLELKDALSTHAWHAMEASRHIADLQLFLKMKELGLK